jgi:hypothetical protein
MVEDLEARATWHPGFVHSCRRPLVATAIEPVHGRPKAVHLHKFECIWFQ